MLPHVTTLTHRKYWFVTLIRCNGAAQLQLKVGPDINVGDVGLGCANWGGTEVGPA